MHTKKYRAAFPAQIQADSLLAIDQRRLRATRDQRIKHACINQLIWSDTGYGL